MSSFAHFNHKTPCPFFWEHLHSKFRAFSLPNADKCMNAVMTIYAFGVFSSRSLLIKESISSIEAASSFLPPWYASGKCSTAASRPGWKFLVAEDRAFIAFFRAPWFESPTAIFTMAGMALCSTSCRHLSAAAPKRCTREGKTHLLLRLDVVLHGRANAPRGHPPELGLFVFKLLE